MPQNIADCVVSECRMTAVYVKYAQTLCQYQRCVSYYAYSLDENFYTSEPLDKKSDVITIRRRTKNTAVKFHNANH